MLLIGVNRSPYTRRVAITLNVYGIAYRQQHLSGFDDRHAVAALNPLGRIPALVLDDGEVLVDSTVIIDHLDETYGRARALVPAAGPERRQILRLAAIMMGACDKALQAAYERNRKPPDKLHQPWIDDCLAQLIRALTTVEQSLRQDQKYLLFDRLTHADIAAVVAERLARLGLGIDTASQMPTLHAIAGELSQTAAFQVATP